ISILLLICFTSCGNPWLDSILNSDSNKKDENIGKGFTGIDDAIEWLKSQPGGTPTNPISLALSIPLGYMPGGNWEDLLNAIDGTGKYVNLDLSACSMNGTIFNIDGMFPRAGYDKVVSIVLPNQAQSIAPNSFMNFSSLTQASGVNIKEISLSAFFLCSSLKSVSFPSATLIGRGAFVACTNLQSVNFPVATSIDEYVFSNCHNLTDVNFPLVTSIGDFSFEKCSSLTEVSFPKLTTIGEGAFESCPLTRVNIPAITYISETAFANTGNDPLTITMGNTPPTLGENMFDGVAGAPNKLVTVQVPAAALTSYVATWENGFEGMGWDSGSTLGGNLNTFITLTVQAIP
ncbi:MAG: leucine-rich repeat domain-containing protein, partial [Spirochaetaceae bacterium]|nr:leucine-rich repeat domain-containing protein [Spirochaetaceae bacterium]